MDGRADPVVEPQVGRPPIGRRGVGRGVGASVEAGGRIDARG